MKTKKAGIILSLVLIWISVFCVACGSDSVNKENAVDDSVIGSSFAESQQDMNVPESEDIANDTLNSGEEINVVGNTLSNIAWGGKFAKEGEWIYYYSWNGVDGEGLYQINIDGTEKKQLYSGMISYINVINGCIYFYDIREDCIKKINPLGEVETLEHGKGRIVAYQDYIYYQYDNGKYRIKADGTDMTMLINYGTSQPLNICDGYLYYVNTPYSVKGESSSAGIYKKAEGVDAERICDYPARDDTMGEFIIVDDNYIYFTESNGIYRVKSDGTDKETIIEFAGEEYQGWDVKREFLVDNEYIYFKCNYDDWYRVKVDGSELVELEWLSGKRISAEANGKYYIAVLDNNIYVCDDSGIRVMNADGKELLCIE